ncbi:sensor histidine kinase [Nocardioides nanhaiensis]|uniref:Oxygen sensor histidine kinase NreB n=1 Tax=Nocardioides nanhaiensis TaxID=1476871 RepID=A0ABP8WDB3_9ACTN
MSPPEPTPAPRRPRRLSSRQLVWLDRTLATGLLLPLLLYPAAGLALVALPLSLAQLVPLYWRRTQPVTVFLLVTAASVTQAVLLDAPLYSQVAFPVAVYSVARFASAAWGVAAVTTGVIGAGVAALDWVRAYGTFTLGDLSAYFLTITVIVVAAWALGTLGRTRLAYVEALIERSDQVQREAAQQVSLAASAERARIAREMHDVVAHGLTTIVVQADGARYAAAQRPEVAVQALGDIGETGREALTQMRRLLGVLRDDDSPATAPQPRLGDLVDLVGGADVESELLGLDSPVADGVALTAYRVVQESLSNVRKHAGPGAAARVRVEVAGDAVVVEVLDDGRGAAADSDGQGLGLLGMHERVAAHDGELHAGPRPGGGFAVRARIPR